MRDDGQRCRAESRRQRHELAIAPETVFDLEEGQELVVHGICIQHFDELSQWGPKAHAVFVEAKAKLSTEE